MRLALRLWGPPLHAPTADAHIFLCDKPEALVETQRGVPRFYVQDDGTPGGLRFGLDLARQGTSDALAALLWKQRDLHQANLARSPVHVKATDRKCSLQNQIEGRSRVVFRVVVVLKLEL